MTFFREKNKKEKTTSGRGARQSNTKAKVERISALYCGGWLRQQQRNKEINITVCTNMYRVGRTGVVLIVKLEASTPVGLWFECRPEVFFLSGHDARRHCLRFKFEYTTQKVPSLCMQI